jgi:uncharacterized FlaG/YvyC family protein
MKLGEIVAISSSSVAVEPEYPSPDLRQEVADRRAVLAAVKELNYPELSDPDRGLNISYDRETKQSIVQIVDRNSGEVLRQIPGKDAVERARYYRELAGL